ncbi:pro-sigmaK processing inhibitor BofA family protein [Solibacillus silvestris]|uniref:pro-sigmaK processing inhibitor BofA family protein n=1 Tax=Solibacillus silvestris TaxID=76853 RepID=UPI003F7FACDB
MRYIVLTMVCFVVLFLFFLNKKSRGKAWEYFAWFWFKIAVVVVVLFMGNLIIGAAGFLFYVPINLFSVLTIVILGLPGMICVSLLILIK